MGLTEILCLKEEDGGQQREIPNISLGPLQADTHTHTTPRAQYIQTHINHAYIHICKKQSSRDGYRVLKV